MSSFITSCFFLLNAIALIIAAETFPLKIISPSTGSNLQFGARVNITVQIPIGSIQSFKDVVLGFSLNETSSHGTSLGLISITSNLISSKTGQLSCHFKIPAKEKFHSSSPTYALVASHYAVSGTSRTFVSNLDSVPITLTEKPTPATIRHPAKFNAEIANISKIDVNASIHAKGHNTGDTLPRLIADEELPVTNTNYSVGATKASPVQNGTNVVSYHNNTGGNNEKMSSGSSAYRVGISAVICVIITSCIFSGTI